MAITLATSAETAPLTGTGTSHSITLPSSNILPGDVIVIYPSTQDETDAGEPSTPAGYTQRWSLGHASSFRPRITSVYRIADGTEEDDVVTFTWGTATETHIVALVWRGVNSATPFDVTQSGPTSGGSNPDPASITTATDGAVVVAVVVGNRPGGTSSPTVSAGYTVAFDQTPDNQAFVIAYKEITSAGAEDPGAYAWSPIDNHTTITDALRPLVVAATGSLALTGTAHGITSLSESASGALTLTGTAHGVAGLFESASGALALTGTAHGSLTRPASGTLSLAGTAAGFARDRKLRFVAQGEQASLGGTWSPKTTNCSLRLFTADVDAALTEAQRNALTEATFDPVEATFTGYAAAALTPANWTVTGGTPTNATHATVTFTCTGAPASPVEIWGYYVTRDSDGALIYYEVFGAAPIPVTDTDDAISFDPAITIQ